MSEDRTAGPDAGRPAAVAAGDAGSDAPTEVHGPVGAGRTTTASATGERPPPLPGPLANLPQRETLEEKPEILVGAVFAGAFLLGRLLRRIVDRGGR